MDKKGKIIYDDPVVRKLRLFIEALLEADTQTMIFRKSNCLDENLIFAHVNNIISDDKQGQALNEFILEHLISCSQCREKIRKVEYMLSLMYVIDLNKVKADMTEEQLTKMKELIQGLFIIAAKRPVKRVVKYAYRDVETQKIHAIVVDDMGKIVLDRYNQPYEVKFGILRAEIDRKGFLTLSLSTSQKEYWEKESKIFLVQATIQIENNVLILPKNKIYPDGRVTITADIKVRTEIRNLPSEAIRIIAQPG